MRDVPFTHQLQTTDEQFLAHLNLRDRSVRGVAEHFRSRKSPSWSFYSHGSAWHQTDAVGSVLEKADNLLRHRFRNSWPPHQWMDLHNGSAHPDWASGLHQAHTSIARATWTTELTTAFALTGRVEYAAKAVRLCRSFVAAFPFELDPRFEEDHDTYFGGEADSTQLTSLRLFRWTDLLHSGALHAAGVAPDEDVFWLVKQIWFYTMQFARLLGDGLRRDNHHLLDHGHVPFVMGLAFPEFEISKALVREGARVIRHHFGHNLLKDGAYAEHSANYQYHVLFHFAHAHGVAKANRYKLFTATQIKSIREWVQFSARAGNPDGHLPNIGDEPGRPLHHLFGTLATPVMDNQIAAMARGLGCVPGSHHHATAADISRAMKQWRPGTPLRFGLSEYYQQKKARVPFNLRGRDPLLPAPATCQYPLGGYTFFRSAWSPDADYLAVSHFAGDYGTHAHWDMMSFLLHTQGKTLIGDPATWLYVSPRFHGHGGEKGDIRGEKGDIRGEKGDIRISRAAAAGNSAPAVGKSGCPLFLQPLPYRGYSYSVDAHNCLVMNDDTLKPLSAMNHGTFWGGSPPKHSLGIFEAGGPIEVAEVCNDANHPTRHRRFFVHIVGIGFALVDLLSKRANNLAPHQYSQYFHFEGDVAISPEAPGTGSPLRGTSGDAACLIVPGGETESRWRTFRDPYLDDVYGIPNQTGAPWIAELTRRIRGQAVFMHLLLTRPARDAARAEKIRCRYLGSAPSSWLDWQDDAISANALDLGDAGTLLVASAPYKRPLCSDELTTDAELAVVHLDARGKVKSWAMARGGKLAVANQRLASGPNREWTAR